MHGRFHFLLIFLLSGIAQGMAQPPDAEGSRVKWMSLQEALHKNEVHPRPILVDFYTSWCGWCKQMMKTTYADSSLAQYINTYFYPAKFDAEGKDTVDFLGKKYGPSSHAPRATHTLTQQLLKDKLMYPTTLFLSNYDSTKKQFGLSMLTSGYLDQKKIEPFLVYTVENVFRSAPYEDFSSMFQKAFSAPPGPDTLPSWIPAREFFRQGSRSKRKTLILITTAWCNSCTVMRRTTFSDSLVAKTLADKFNLVELDAQSRDTLFFNGRPYAPSNSPAHPFHPLATALTRGQLILPTLTVLDEDAKPLDAIEFYVHPGFLDQIARFYGDDNYKTKSWQTFLSDQKKGEKE